MRSLNQEFVADLKDGILAPLRRAVISDSSLCMELRGNYVNIYYRGGNLMRITQLPKGYKFFFDPKYFSSKNAVVLPTSSVSARGAVVEWIEFSPRLKQAMDLFFGKSSKDEREFQQLLVRENNFGRVAKGTDFFVCDIEYQEGSSRFDAVAVHWPGRLRRTTNNRRLVLVEMKYGDKSLPGESGLHAHVADVNNFLSHPGLVEELKDDMVRVFNQKVGLGLLNCGKDLNGFSEELPVVLLVLANHNPRSRILRDELRSLPDCPHGEVRIATASFLGYGLYDQGIHTVDQIIRGLGN